MNALLRQRGVATIELALILGLVLMLMSCTLLFGTAFWYLNAEQKTVHNMARYLASVTQAEIANQIAATTAVNTAREMGDEALDRAKVSTSIARAPAALSCQPNTVGICGFAMPAGYPAQTPATIRVVHGVRLDDISFFGDVSVFLGGTDALSMAVDMTVPYVP